MTLYVDSESKIRAVNASLDSSLTPLYVNENAPDFPFKGWSNAKICCYKVTVSNGVITMMTPYVDSRMLDAIDSMGHQIDSTLPYKATKTAYYGEKEKIFYDLPEGIVSVLFDNYNGDYSVNRVENRLIVSFDTLDQETNITILIQ